MDSEITVCKLLAPEDIRQGDYITPLRETRELFNFWAACDPLTQRELTLRVDFLASDAGQPLRVVAVCLPFVLVEDAADKYRTLDLRRQVVARLDEAYARKAMKRLSLAEAVKDS